MGHLWTICTIRSASLAGLAYSPWILVLSDVIDLCRLNVLTDELYHDAWILLFYTFLFRIENAGNGHTPESIPETPLDTQKTSRSWTVPSKAKELPFGSNTSNGIQDFYIILLHQSYVERRAEQLCQFLGDSIISIAVVSPHWVDVSFRNGVKS